METPQALFSEGSLDHLEEPAVGEEVRQPGPHDDLAEPLLVRDALRRRPDPVRIHVPRPHRTAAPLPTGRCTTFTDPKIGLRRRPALPSPHAERTAPSLSGETPCE